MFISNFMQVFIQFFTAQVAKFISIEQTVGSEEFFCITDKRLQIPVFRINFSRSIHSHGTVYNLFYHFHDVFAQICFCQDFFTLSVNNFTLLVHNVVIFQNVFTNVKVTTFNFLLRIFDGFGYEAMFDGFIIFHTKFIHNACNIITAKETHQIVFQGQEEFRGTGVTLTSATTTQLVIDTTAFVTFSTNDVQTTKFRYAFAKHNVSTTTCHVGSNGNCTVLTCMRNNFCFLFMVLSVQYVMSNTATFKHCGKFFRLSDGSSTYENRSTRFMTSFDFVNRSFVFSKFSFVDYVRSIGTNHRFIGGNNYNAQVVDFLEFLFLGFSGTGHTSQFVVHTEVVLESDGCQSLAFTFYFYAFLSFDCLVQTFGETTTKHQTTGEFVNDDNLTIFNYVVTVTMHQSFCFQCAHNLMGEVNTMFSIIQVFNAKHLFRFSNTYFSRSNLFSFFVYSIIFTFAHSAYNLCKNSVQVSRFFTRTGDDKRSTRFVNQNTVNFVDDTEVQFTLNHLVNIYYHIVTQIVETKFIVGTISNVCHISSTTFMVIHIVNNQTYTQAQCFVDSAHIFAVTFCQVIIYGYNVNTFTGQCIQINGKGCYQGFTFTSTHFSNFAAMQYDTANHLYVEMTHTGYTTRSLANNCKCFRQQII